MTSDTSQAEVAFRSVENRVLDALHASIGKWGLDKVTIDDVAHVSGVSRATIYRMFPGGREVLLESLRVRNLNEFFVGLREAVGECETLGDLVVEIAVYATGRLRSDEQLVAMLASQEPTVLRDLTVDGLPRIISVASSYLRPLLDDHLPTDASGPFVDLLARLVVSHFLAPSAHVDLADRASARDFLAPLVSLIDAASVSDPVTEPVTRQGAHT